MRVEAYQYEFPLRQGEFGFLEEPAVNGLGGVLGSFAWWTVLFIETREFLPCEPFDGMADLFDAGPFDLAIDKLALLVGCMGRYFGEYADSPEALKTWLDAVAADVGFRLGPGEIWHCGAVKALHYKWQSLLR